MTGANAIRRSGVAATAMLARKIWGVTVRSPIVPMALCAVALGSPATAAGAPYVCYYNPTEPCYSTYVPGGGDSDIKPVYSSFGDGGNGVIAYSNNDHGGTVYASAAGGYSPGGYVVFAELTHFISVDLKSGPADALVPLRIIAGATYIKTGTGGFGSGSYIAEQNGRRLTAAMEYSGPNMSGIIFDINPIVYVTPNVPIAVFLQARASVNPNSAATIAVNVDPIYEIVGDYASRYQLTGLLSSDTAPPALPEPASWAMMIVGFGAIGTQMRRRRTSLCAA